MEYVHEFKIEVWCKIEKPELKKKNQHGKNRTLLDVALGVYFQSYYHFNPLNTKRRLLYLKTQFVAQ